MLEELIEDFRNSEQCIRAWTDRIWQRRTEAEHALNLARVSDFQRRKAFLSDRDLPAYMRAQAPAAGRTPRPVTALEVLRILKAG